MGGCSANFMRNVRPNWLRSRAMLLRAASRFPQQKYFGRLWKNKILKFMEFKTLRILGNSFNRSIVTFCFVVLCFGSRRLSSLSSLTSLPRAWRQKIYVLDNSKSLMVALSRICRSTWPNGDKEQCEQSLMELFFTTAPDKMPKPR